jgi:energy-coupling factor transporter ATP-binding protein EcfA2
MECINSKGVRILNRARQSIDTVWHDSYTGDRVELQNRWILSKVENYLPVEKPRLIFTAGAMGSGKTHSLRALSHLIDLNINNTLIIDPDRFKEIIPEYSDYKKANLESAGTLVHKESVLMSELALHYALHHKLNIVVDGSLKDWEWHRGEFQRIRETHPAYDTIEIFYVQTDWDIVLKRANDRGLITGRHIKPVVLRAVYDAVPISIENLIEYVDKIYEVINNTTPSIQIVRSVRRD